MSLQVLSLRRCIYLSLFAFGITGMIPASFAAPKPAEPKAAKASKKERKPADLSLSTVKIPDEFDLSLYAHPPDVAYPTSVSVAPDGSTLFVAIDENSSLDAKPNRGKIIRCVDSDGDGKADKFNVFATMDSPRGVIWEPKGKGGVLYVMHPPNLTAYYDDSGKGVAERQEDLVAGLGFDLKFRGADHTTNGCRLGIDGWIYVACGDYGAVEAKGKDGNILHMKGGGVVRVRPDGSGLEFVSRGQRNIYDVAISPTLDLFTRDNTNDGDGWNDRLSHVITGATYGYPSLFKHFKGEFIDALIDFGGGSPTGSLWLDEPDYPGDWGHGLYTVEWGRNGIENHPLTANGASWKAEDKIFIKMPRPTDMDCDAVGHLYISSWEGATYTYAGPQVGYIIRVTPKGMKSAAFPDVTKLAETDLIRLLGAPSATRRLSAQREILHRGLKTAADDLATIANSNATIPVRVAAIFTLKQLMGEQSHPALLTMLKKPEIREFALKALADDLRVAARVSAQPFVAALSDPNPRVRLQAITGLGRMNKLEGAASMIPLTADPDTVVAHVATRYLTSMNAVDACLKAVDSGNDKIRAGALQALYGMYDPRVVDGLTTRLAATKDSQIRRGILNALCRLDQREAEYEAGKWWGTRPDTKGPLYKGDRWAASEKIEATLKDSLDHAQGEEARWLVSNMYMCKVEIPGLLSQLLTKSGSDTAAKLTAIEGMFTDKDELPDAALSVVKSVAADEKENATMRAHALRLLQRASETDLDDAITGFAPFARHEGLDPAINSAFEDFTRDTRHAKNIGSLSKLAEEKDPDRRALVQILLINLTTNRLAKADDKKKAEHVIEQLWAKPELVAGLLNAIGRTGAKDYAEQVRSKLNDPDNTIAESALAAYQKLGLKDSPTPASELIGSLKYEEVLAKVIQAKGDPALGKELFMRQGCIACHTTSASEPPKGPMLAAVAKIYGRPELCESVIKPNARLAQGFESQWFETKKGERIEGFVTREGGDSIDVRNIAGQSVKLEIGDIKERGKRETSMMPEGLVNNLTPAEFANLLAFIESLKTN